MKHKRTARRVIAVLGSVLLAGGLLLKLAHEPVPAPGARLPGREFVRMDA